MKSTKEKQQHERAKTNRRKRGRWSQIKAWTPELLSATLSITLLLITILLLHSQDNKTSRNLISNLDLTLNGLLQLLITVIQFSFSYPLARGLAQLKWLWFWDGDGDEVKRNDGGSHLGSKSEPYSRSQSLYGFEIYDEACRSNLWGSLKLIFRLLLLRFRLRSRERKSGEEMGQRDSSGSPEGRGWNRQVNILSYSLRDPGITTTPGVLTVCDHRFIALWSAAVLASAVLSGPVTQQVLSIDTTALGPSPDGTATVGRLVSMSKTNPDDTSTYPG